MIRPEARAYERRWLILGVLCISLLVIVLDNFILNVAIPMLVGTMGVTDDELQWIVDAYTITFAGLLLTAGALGDRYGRRGGLQIGLAVFGLGSLASALAGSPDQLIAARAVMGVGGAFIMPATLSILTEVFPAHERPRAIGIWTGVAGIAVVLGPVVGGLLVTHFYWGSVFLVNLPIVAVGLIAGVVLVPTSRDPDATRLDLVGAALSIVSLCALLYAIIEAPGKGWTSPEILLTVGAAAVGFVVFIAWELRVEHPMLDPRFFGNARFSGASGSITVAFFAMFGLLYLMTQYFQFVLGYTPLQAGLRMLPFAAVFVILAPLSARVVERYGTTRTVSAGLVLVTIGLALLATVAVDSSYTAVCVRMLFLAAGLGLVMPPATEAVMGALPQAKAGVGSAVNDTTRELGGALGIAVVGSLVASTYMPVISGFFAGSPVPPDAVHTAEGGIGRTFAVADAIRAQPIPVAGQYADALVATARQAFVDGMHRGLFVAAVVAGLGAAAVARWLPARAPEAGLAAGPAEPAGLAGRAATPTPPLPVRVRRLPAEPPRPLPPPPAPVPATPMGGPPPVPPVRECRHHPGAVRLYGDGHPDSECPWCLLDVQVSRTTEWIRVWNDATAQARRWKARADDLERALTVAQQERDRLRQEQRLDASGNDVDSDIAGASTGNGTGELRQRRSP